MSEEVNQSGGLHEVSGFHCAGLAIGPEHKGRLGLVYADDPTTVGSAVYTRNDVKAAPVLLSKHHDQIGSSKRAILINSGAANAFTGRVGFSDAQKCAATLAETLGLNPAQIYLGSTGAIGTPLPMPAILARIPELAAGKGPAEANAREFVRAIMTTDTRPKQASIQYRDAGAKVTIAAALKGAGMIMPNMATMLCVVATDAAIAPEVMHLALRQSVEDTFHHATVDGDTSTNDTVFLLANGRALNTPIAARGAPLDAFVRHMTQLFEHLVKEMIHDGEGMTKFITIHVRGVPTEEDGRKIAFSIANSPLVKTALFGNQMNWGRLMMAAGKAGTGLDFGHVDLWVNKVAVLAKGEVAGANAVDEAAARIRGSEIQIEFDMNQGARAFTAWTCDFSVDYVKINANYLT